jgi:DNA-binding GntR family transcriptional regulator
MTKRSENNLQADKVAELIEADIIFGRLLPRERLVEETLMLRTGAKRHAVRSALDELERKGLIAKEPNKGASVRALSEQDVRKVYDMRALLHAAAAERIPFPVDPTLLSELRNIQEAYEAAIAEEDLMLVVILNDRFHATLFSGSGNEYLCEDIERYAGMVRLIRSYSIADPRLLQKSRGDHAAMIEALEQEDRTRLKELCITHIQAAREEFGKRAPRWSSPIAT